MAAKLTEYERVVSILTRQDKKKVIAWCDTNRFSLAEITRQALKAFFSKRGIDICQKL